MKSSSSASIATASILLLLLVLPSHGYSDNCVASAICLIGPKSDCRDAFARYQDLTIYNKYTVIGACTATFRCSGTYTSITGAVLKSLFNNIYSVQKCGKCGSHAFLNGQCEVTLNYCDPDKCKEVNQVEVQ